MDERRNRYMCDCWPRGELAVRPIASMEMSHWIVLDRFLILLRGRRNATRCAPKRVNGKAALGRWYQCNIK